MRKIKLSVETIYISSLRIRRDNKKYVTKLIFLQLFFSHKHGNVTFYRRILHRLHDVQKVLSDILWNL